MANLNEILKNKGKIVEVEGQNLAILNDGDEPKAFSTACPHLGCDVEWNDSEDTWNCPCHGSCFHADGSLKRGPARRGLDPVEIKIENDEIKLL